MFSGTHEPWAGLAEPLWTESTVFLAAHGLV